MELKRIGVVAEEAGVAASTIRYYERIGLLPEPQRQGGSRRYGASAMGHLRLIRSAQQAGFTLGEIQTLLNGFPPSTPPSIRWHALSRSKIDALEKKIAHLRRMKSMLANTLRCNCATLAECASQGCDGRDDRYASLCGSTLPVRNAS